MHMRRGTIPLLLLFHFIALCTFGCGSGSDDATRVLFGDDYEEVDQFVLYSIDGSDAPHDEALTDAELFHGWPVLGQTEVTSVATRNELMKALEIGVMYTEEGRLGSSGRIGAPSDGNFSPRCAIRVVKGEQITEYLICFECSHVHIYIDGQFVMDMSITESPRDVFDRALTKAGLPLD